MLAASWGAPDGERPGEGGVGAGGQGEVEGMASTAAAGGRRQAGDAVSSRDNGLSSAE